MIVGIMEKSSNIIKHTFTAKSIRNKIGYPISEYIAFEIDENKHKEAYYYDSITDSVLYNDLYTPPPIDYNAISMEVVKNAIEFGNNLFIKYAGENVAMGITQAGKTKEVADYLINVDRYLRSGSLYEVMSEIETLISNGLPLSLAPFITEERLNSFKQEIQTYLSK